MLFQLKPQTLMLSIREGIWDLVMKSSSFRQCPIFCWPLYRWDGPLCEGTHTHTHTHTHARTAVVQLTWYCFPGVLFIHTHLVQGIHTAARVPASMVHFLLFSILSKYGSLPSVITGWKCSCLLLESYRADHLDKSTKLRHQPSAAAISVHCA